MNMEPPQSLSTAKLDINYRCSGNIVQAAGAILDRSTSRQRQKEAKFQGSKSSRALVELLRHLKQPITTKNPKVRGAVSCAFEAKT